MYRLIHKFRNEENVRFSQDFDNFKDAQNKLMGLFNEKCFEFKVDRFFNEENGTISQKKLWFTFQYANSSFDYFELENEYWKIYQPL